MRIVLSIGGSILVPEEVDVGYIGELASFLVDLSSGNEIAVVSGGGRLARKYIDAARVFNSSEALCDLIGIDASRLNARLLSAAIGDTATIEPPSVFQKAREELERGKIMVMGGTHPGHSTDGVSALLAEYVGADLLINATDVDGIFDKNPREYADARLIEEITPEGLMDIIKKYSVDAGSYALIDPLAVKIIQRSAIKTIFLNGRDFKNMEKAISGKKYRGTRVKK
ncbi:MAG: uridylate kinase [Candidatus Altiarchaeales archaeon ex4484_2]|nr:MAG: uridylate kinase [Candidatus Altiarchaeales archaeon ex4484_2]